MLIYAASDTKYFAEHGIEFITSCVENNNKCVVSIFPNLEESIDIQQSRLKTSLNSLKQKLTIESEKLLTIYLEEISEYSQFNIIENRSLYASYRFLKLYDILNIHQEDVLVLDIDSIVLKQLHPIEADLGFYLRLNNNVGSNEYEKNGMKIAAGILFVSKNEKQFAFDLKEAILKRQIMWFVDQHALLEVYKKYKSDKHIFDFAETKWLDWNFLNDTYIWTAKGESRKSDPTYINKKKDFR